MRTPFRNPVKRAIGVAGQMYDRFLVLPRNIKQASLLAIDLTSIPFALWLAMVLRLGHGDFRIGLAELTVCLVTMAVTATAFLRLGLYRAVIRYMGHQAIVAIVQAVTISSVAMAIAAYATGTFMPRTVPFIYWSLILVLAGGTRLALRSYYHHKVVRARIPVAIYGAGAAGRELLHALLHGDRYLPILFVDDNPSLQGTVINGVAVESPERLETAIERDGIREVFLALAAVEESRRREIINSLVNLPLYVRTIPRFSDLVAGKARIAELRDITLEELLGRAPVPPHPELLAAAIGGRNVMVTGAGGSIGSELCRQILAAGPRELILFDISEFGLYSIERNLRELALMQGSRVKIVPLLGNVQNGERLYRVMRAFEVDTVFHTAAYKHVPLVEHNVAEGVANNVFGTEAAARAAISAGVDNFVLISSDKAVRPTNVMGASKRMSERILQALAAEQTATRFTMVRFGNVLGSSGSVVPLFREQIAAGGPVTLTHSEVERYFITIPEAAQLVLQAAAMGQGGDVFVLEMGEAIRIGDLARRMIRLMGRTVRDQHNPQGDIEIRLTGLRPGEKMCEELLVNGLITETGHPMIMRADEPLPPRGSLDASLDALRAACQRNDCESIRALLAGEVQGYSSDEYPCVDELTSRENQQIDEAPIDALNVRALFSSSKVRSKS